MKQVLQYMNSGETKVVDIPVPQVKAKTALVRTAASLVSAGTERSLVEFAEKNLVQKASSRPDLVRQVLDKAKREGVLTTLDATFNRLDQPMALGYSSAGTIVEVGEGLQGFKVGDRVVCAGGNHAVHAEFAVIPQNLLAHLPDDIPFDSACFATLGAIALNGIRLARLQLGDRVAIVGLGLLGLLTTRLVTANGCLVTGVDTSPQRVKFAKKSGIAAFARDQIVAKTSALTGGVGFDAVLICAATSSDDTVHLAGEIARDRGSVISLGVVGLNIPRKPYYEKELFFQVSRSSGPGRYDPLYEEEGHDYPLGYVRWTEGRNLQAFVALLQSEKLLVNDLITHRFPINEAAKAYALITDKTAEPYLGVVLTYPQTGQKAASHVAVNPVVTLTDKVNVGVIGAGNYAKATFLPAMRKNSSTNLVAIASINGVNAQHAASKFAFGYASSSAQELLKDKSINSIVIMTRHDEHAALTLQALQSGKHVYCEKPLALTVQELADIEVLLSKPETPVLMAGFNRRFAPLSLHLKDFLSNRSEALYAHYTVNAGFLPANHWLHDRIQGGGRIIGEACHFIDYLTFLVGQAPCAIQALALPDQGKYHQDNMQLTLEFPDGSIGSIAYLANGDKTFPKERVEVFCGGKVAVLDDFRSLSLTANGNRKKFRSPLRQDKGHAASWAAFVEAIRSTGKAPIPYNQMLAVSRIAILAGQAAAQKTRIELA
ncbi:MAG: Gfo/Idh/MocA family oxidoreductase [Chloroflexi bacterium]|nr:Gfo/Idh/MocA family oxidoreductase [Chloroflexota bacterium]